MSARHKRPPKKRAKVGEAVHAGPSPVLAVGRMAMVATAVSFGHSQPVTEKLVENLKAAGVVVEYQPPPHVHADGPFRCCEAEPAERVLRKLKASPPERLGKRHLPPRHPDGKVAWGESQEAFEQRQAAWRAAIEREQGYVKEGR